MNHIVLGAGFGDEGKGATVSRLIKAERPNYIIRFNGGQQAGHTVIHDGKRHVFSNFGAGSLQGIPTYWSEYCTVHPLGILNEFDALAEKGIRPVMFIDPLCPVTTPFDVKYNQDLDGGQKHGSVGVGFGATIARQEAYYKLFAQDLLYEVVLRTKLELIAKHYGFERPSVEIDRFMAQCAEMLNLPTVQVKTPVIKPTHTVIFEGAQGILLDMDHGFFPHVTRSNTTCVNALKLVERFGLERPIVDYITRTYLTRHGYGPLPFECYAADMGLTNIEDETNVYNDWQKAFRYAPLNLDLLQYAIISDQNYSRHLSWRLNVTCLDQVPAEIEIISQNKRVNIQKWDIEDFMKRIVTWTR
jgi:adenylosuccinate synthase